MREEKNVRGGPPYLFWFDRYIKKKVQIGPLEGKVQEERGGKSKKKKFAGSSKEYVSWKNVRGGPPFLLARPLQKGQQAKSRFSVRAGGAR